MRRGSTLTQYLFLETYTFFIDLVHDRLPTAGYI